MSAIDDVAAGRKRRCADNIVGVIVEDITARSGLGDEWDNIDPDLQAEILSIWFKLIVAEIDKMDGEEKP